MRCGMKDRGLLAWLWSAGITHVYVDMAEVRRVAGSYGPAATVPEDIHDRLKRMGLVDVRPEGFMLTDEAYWMAVPPR